MAHCEICHYDGYNGCGRVYPVWLDADTPVLMCQECKEEYDIALEE